MAQDAIVNGTTYPGVEAVLLKDADGNTEVYYPDAVRHVPQDLDAEKQAQARQNIGAIGTDELDTALEEALTEAKESGEFDGDPGASGVYTLGNGETLEDAPEDASVVIDPDGTPSTEKWVFTLADGSTVERTVYLA